MEQQEKKKNYKGLNILFGVILGILLAGTITFASLYAAKGGSTPVTPSKFEPTVSGYCTDSSLIGSNEGYVQINSTKYYYLIDEAHHKLDCDYKIVGGETMYVHTSANATIEVIAKTSYGENQLYKTGDGGETEYTFTAEAEHGYHISISFPLM